MIWLGGPSPLLDNVWLQFDVHHISSLKQLIQVLSWQPEACIVVDLAQLELDVESLLQSVRAKAPAAQIVMLADGKFGFVLDGVLIDPAVHSLSRDADAAALQTLLSDLASRTDRQPPADPGSLSTSYADLERRSRHLEGLLQAAFGLTNALDEASIIGDLREGARVAVDADEVAVLLADDHYTDLSDTLALGVNPAYLQVCREQFRTLSFEERIMYLGDEVLLRERSPDMLPTAPRVREAAAAEAWSYMRLPLIIDQRLAGCVALFSSVPGQFDGAHLQLGRLYATQVSTTVRNMQLFWRLNRAEQRQQAVAEVARLIAENLTLADVLGRIVEQAVELVGGERGAVLLVQPDKSLVVSALYGDTDSSSLLGQRLAPGHAQAGVVALTGQPSIVANFSDWEFSTSAETPSKENSGTLLGVPLIYRGRVLGVLQVVADNVSPEDVMQEQDILMTLAPQAATAIAKAQLHELVHQERVQLQAILDHTVAAVVVCDGEGRVSMINPEARRVLTHLGIHPDDLVGRRLVDFLKEEVPDLIPQLPHLPSAVEINLGEAGQYLVHISAISRADGTIEQYVGVGQDVSQLRRLDRIKSDLIHILSHDLRNPLGLARGSIDLLDVPDLPQDQRAQLKEMIVHSLDRMEELIQDVVDLEMAESMGLETALPFKLASVVEQVVRRNQSKAKQQDVTLLFKAITPPERRMRGHGILVAQAIDNLISNAIKYTPSGGQIEVTLNCNEEHAFIAVKDTGLGIPVENLPYVFDQFYRVPDKRTRHIPGTGLGLSLVRTIVQAHGGYVEAESEVDVGSIFTIYLPLTIKQPERIEQPRIMQLDLSTLAARPTRR